MSESHQRQMELFSQNSTTFMDEFSQEFEEGMLEIIQRKARSQRCSANVIYRECAPAARALARLPPSAAAERRRAPAAGTLATGTTST